MSYRLPRLINRLKFEAKREEAGRYEWKDMLGPGEMGRQKGDEVELEASNGIPWPGRVRQRVAQLDAPCEVLKSLIFVAHNREALQGWALRQ